MSGPIGAVAFAAAFAVAVCVACAQNNVGQMGQSGSPVGMDTLVGIVREVGSDPATHLVLEMPAGAGDRPLTGDSARPLRSVLGAQVRIYAEHGPSSLVVREFEVQSVNDVPVDDGVVLRATQSGGLELAMRSGQRRPLPPDLERVIGSRVWVSRAVAGRAVSFGVIRAF